MARPPWGGRALAGPRSLSGALSSSPIAARGLDVSRERRSQKGGVSGRTRVGGIAWEGRAPARPRSCQRALSSSPIAARGLDVPRGPTFPGGGGGSERVGRSVGALPWRVGPRPVGGVGGGYVIEADRGPWARRSQGYDVPGGGFRGRGAGPACSA